jgi:hypothetical protein
VGKDRRSILGARAPKLAESSFSIPFKNSDEEVRVDVMESSVACVLRTCSVTKFLKGMADTDGKVGKN